MGFEPPPGDPDALDGALKTLGTVGTDLHGRRTTVQSGFAEALSTWHGTRADDFRKASAGMQLQVSEASSSLDTMIADLKGYSKLLRTNTDEIKQLKVQADQRNATADAFAKAHPTSDTAVDLEYQHASMFVSHLEAQAEDLRAAVRKAASATAGLIDAATDLAVPRSSTLSPAEIARRVHGTTGVSGIEQAIAAGTLTADQAWTALVSPSTEVPEDAINADGSINGDKLAEDVNAEEKEEAENPGKKAIDTTLDYWTLTTAPPGAWSLRALANAAQEFSEAKSKLPLDLYKLTQAELDAVPKGPGWDPESVLKEIEEGPKWTPADDKALSTWDELGKAQKEIGGLGKFEAVGRIFDGLAVVGDVWTLADPDSATDDKVDAGVNLVGLGMTTAAGTELVGDGLVATGLLAADASLGWVPVVGWGLVAVTAGYEVYKHWDEITDLTGKATHAVTSFVSKHIPHIHLW